MNSLNILVAGPAGSGLESMAHSLALSFTREGLFVHTTSEYENRIRGGHNYSYIRVSHEKLTSHSNTFDLVIAMDKRSVEEHINEVKKEGFIIFDESIKTEEIENKNNIKLIPIPSLKLAGEAGLKLVANIVAIGAVMAILERSTDSFKTVIRTIFSRKGEEIVNINYKALDLGYEYINNNIDYRNSFKIQGDGKERFLMDGNEAIALGSIKGGLKYLAAYPMTPGSTIMTTLAKEARNYDIVVMHTEDEISAVNMAIGGGYAGVRSATSTSGGGFALMSEALSLAGMTETPVVIFLAQRPGPSTGLSTKTAQGDLRMAMHSGQGDFPRLVVAAGNHDDCVQLSAEAFNYAEKYQLPVIFLTEKYIADSYQTCEKNIADGIKVERGKIATKEDLEKAVRNEDNRFPRYSFQKDGVSPRPIPGMKDGEFLSSSYEHDEYGLVTNDTQVIVEMMEKRYKKMKELEKELPEPIVHLTPGVLGTPGVVLLVWGGTIGPALEAQKTLKENGKDIAIVQMQYIHPFKSESVKKILKDKIIICIEGNQTGQFESVLREKTGIIPNYSLRKFDGEPISGEWIIEKFNELNL